MKMIQKSCLISAALHIFVFLGFWVSPKKPVTPVSSIPVTVELINTPSPIKSNTGSLSKKSVRSVQKEPRRQKKLTLSDLAPNWDLSVPSKDSIEPTNYPRDKTESFSGGSAMDILNKPELVYSSYYQRIHDKLDYYWQSKIKYSVMKKQNSGDWKYQLSKVTKTRVVLDAQGNLKRVLIISSSGEQELDASALEAFKEASPFPNPPRDLVKNDEVSINWDFILEIHE